jgi:hypothetical protein
MSEDKPSDFPFDDSIPADVFTLDKPPHSYLSKLHTTADPPSPFFREQTDLILQNNLPQIWELDLGGWKIDELLPHICLTFLKHQPELFCIFSLPNFPDHLFFEATSRSSLELGLLQIPQLGELIQFLVELTPDEILMKFCNETRFLRFRPGTFVTIHGGLLDGDFGQVIHVFVKEGEILLKVLPRIDYDYLKVRSLASQNVLNGEMDISYRPPLALFNEDPLLNLDAMIESVTMEIGSVKL